MSVAWRYITALLLLALVGACVQAIGSSSGDPTVVVFYQRGCVDCLRMEKFLEGLRAEFPDLKIAYYDVYEREAQELLRELSSVFDVEATDFPVVFVGETATVGRTRGKELHLRECIRDCISRSCPSPLSRVDETGLAGTAIPGLQIAVIGGAALVLLLLLLLLLL